MSTSGWLFIGSLYIGCGVIWGWQRRRIAKCDHNWELDFATWSCSKCGDERLHLDDETEKRIFREKYGMEL